MKEVAEFLTVVLDHEEAILFLLLVSWVLSRVIRGRW